MTSWYAFPNPLLRARRNLYHPLAPSHAPRLQTPLTLCARALYTATARILVHADMRLYGGYSISTFGRTAIELCFELGNNWRRYPHLGIAGFYAVCGLWGAVVVTGAVFPSDVAAACAAPCTADALQSHVHACSDP